MITEEYTSGYLLSIWSTSTSKVTFNLFLINNSNRSIRVTTDKVAIKVFYY